MADLGWQINVDNYRGRDRDRGGPDPNSARSPTGVLSRSTTGDIDSSNALFPHSDRVVGPRPRGCAHHPAGWLYPVSIPPFRPHAGTSLYGRHLRAPAALLPGTKAQPSSLPSLPSFQIVESSCSPFVSLTAKSCRHAASLSTHSIAFALGRFRPDSTDFMRALSLFRYSAFGINFEVSCLRIN